MFGLIDLGEDGLEEVVRDQANVLDSYKTVSQNSLDILQNQKERLTPNISHSLFLRKMKERRHRHLGRLIN